MESKENKWLNDVRQILLSLNIKHPTKSDRLFLFKDTLILDKKSWLTYFNDGYTPRKAVNEDLELPWVEYKKHIILF